MPIKRLIKRYKIFVGIIALLLIVIITCILYLKITCKAIQITKLHNGETRYSIVNESGDNHEPANCNGSLIIQSME